MSEHRVVYRRDRTGRWVASIKGLRRCRGRGKTLRRARLALRKALAPMVEDPHAIDFVEDVTLPGSARRRLVQHWSARRRVQAALQKAEASTLAAAEALRALKLTLRDACDLLGLTPAKLEQVRRRQR